MEEAQKQAVLSAVRSVLGAIGGFLVGKGIADVEFVAQVIGAVMAAIPLFWGVWDKFQAEAKTKEREAVAVNVGIKVADGTKGPTPPVSAEETPAIIAAHPDVEVPK